MKYYALLFLFLFSSQVFAENCIQESILPSSTPDSRFLDNGNGTITDIGTNLMWQKCQLGTEGENCQNDNPSIRFNWQEALEVASMNSFAGYDDWRLPNVKELRSIVEQRCFNPAINSIYFPNTFGSNFMSASPDDNSESYVWRVSFFDGTSGRNFRYSTSYVRLVRYTQ